ncbi:hypothetical protein YC2023_033165 [Brassica napus]
METILIFSPINLACVFVILCSQTSPQGSKWRCLGVSIIKDNYRIGRAQDCSTIRSVEMLKDSILQEYGLLGRLISNNREDIKVDKGKYMKDDVGEDNEDDVGDYDVGEDNDDDD